MATLNGESLLPGDTVYDICYGGGTVSSIDACNKINVSFGSAGRPRQYSEKGMTGKHCNRTLFHQPPAIIEFGRDECEAIKKKCALQGVLDIFGEMAKLDCSEVIETCDEPTSNCCN